MIPPVNIRVLAKNLNLSIGTVSKALKDSYEISAETKRRVLEMARQLNYTPNPYASSLRRKKSKTIAVVVPDVADSFFSLAIKGIEDIAQRKGYHVLIYLTYESLEKEKKILEDAQNGRVDGVLLSVSRETHSPEHIEALLAAGIPLIFFDRSFEGIETARVQTDDYTSSYKATQHLLAQGCRRIAFLSISPHLDIAQKRLNGYKAALAEQHLPFLENLLVPCTNNEEENHAILLQLLKRKYRPDGVIASVEKLITPFYLACSALALHIPRDIKVLGFCNLPTAQILQPALTTVIQPAFEMGRSAATLLFNAVEKKTYAWQKEEIILPSELIFRRSSAG